MIENVTFAGVYHNDPERVDKLLEYAKKRFRHVVVGVQANVGKDETFAVASKWADEVVLDTVAGFCEPTIGKVLAKVPTDWVLLVSADEWPDEELLGSLEDAVALAEHGDDYSTIDAWWIHFLSTIDGAEYYSEQDNHLRLFKTALGWPRTMHSKPPASFPGWWRKGNIRHDRSLDEMVQDYLRYFQLGRGDAGWEAHNKMMIRTSIEATAQRKGWDYVRAFPWFEQAKDLVFVEPEINDWDGWRAAYGWMDWEDQIRFYDKIWNSYPDQNHFSPDRAADFFAYIKPTGNVIEVGGWQGHLAQFVRGEFPKDAEWHNYEVCRLAVENSIPEGDWYFPHIPEDFVWKLNLGRFQTLVMSHSLEHMRLDEFRQLVAKLPDLDYAYLQSPILGDQAADWTGYGGTHIFEGSWADVTSIMQEAGLELVPELSGDDVRSFARQRKESTNGH